MSPSTSPRHPRNWFEEFDGLPSSSGRMHAVREYFPRFMDKRRRWILYVRVRAWFGDREVDGDWYAGKKIVLNILGEEHPIPMQFARDFVRDVHWVPGIEGFDGATWVQTLPAALFEPIVVPEGARVDCIVDPLVMLDIDRALRVQVMLGGNCALTA